MLKSRTTRRWFVLALILSAAPFSFGSTNAQETSKILMLGATRNTGFETVKLLLDQGYDVTVMVRPTSDLSNLETTAAKTVVGDAFDESSVEDAMSTGPYWAVVSNLSGKTPDGRYVDGVGNVHAINAAEAAGVKRFILVSTIGAGESVNAIPPDVQKILGHIFKEKDKAEERLMASDMDYTIIRPGGLYDGPPNEKGIMTEEANLYGRVARGEVARLTVKALNDDETIGKIYSVVDSEF